MADEYTRRLANQFAVDRTQIDNRRILGDDLARLREVEHFAYLPTEEAAGRAVERLESAGFRCSTISYGDTHVVSAVRADAVDEESARYFVREVTGIVSSLGGDYDGWGAPVVNTRRPLVVIPDSPEEIDWR
ncbi:MAG: ribonuclease E inhibitor RraB [Leifsonia sp.]